jgi:hypothetical protein
MAKKSPLQKTDRIERATTDKRDAVDGFCPLKFRQKWCKNSFST